MAEKRIDEFLNIISKDLDRTVDFWLKHSIDAEYGGFYTCLSRSGSLYDDLKYGWMQGRQTWMLARLYNEVERFKRPDILEAAEKGAEFMLKYLKDPKTWRCFFLLTRDGRPKKIQRTIFTEVFYVMGMSEIARATQKKRYMDEATGMMKKIIHWTQVDDTELGRPKLSGNEATSSFAVALMSLGLVLQMVTVDPTLEEEYKEFRETCVKDLMKHVQRDGSVVLEDVSTEGTELPGSVGRLMCPGHALEGGWFLLELAQMQHDESLRQTAIDTFIVKPFHTGWDVKYGGLMYFMDVDGHPPCQLEWDMKLWWVHNEALIAFLMAYEHTGDKEHLENFVKLFDYSYSQFVDEENGEWFGYLNRQGDVSMDFKGGAFKGCYHVPRYQYTCEQILQRIKAKAK